VVLLTASIGLTITATIFISYDQIQQRQTLIREMLVLTKVVALRSAVALSFEDKINALDNLKALNIRSKMQLACIYNKNNQLFVNLALRGQMLSCAPSLDTKHEKIILSDESLEVIEPMLRNGHKIGWLLTRVGLNELQARLQRQVIVCTSAIFLSLILSFALTSRLQRLIYTPIVRLGKVASSITLNRNYSIRVPAEGKDEIGKTVSAFNDMLDLIQKDKESLTAALTSTQQSKDDMAEFTSMISHELRTPIAVLQCELELLIDGIEEPTVENLNSLQEEVMHLNTLIQDMYELALSDTRMLKYEMDTLCIKQSIERSIDLFKWQFKDHSIQMDIDLNPIIDLDIKGDRTRLKQVFDNLLKNSLSYTDADGQLKISSAISNDTIKIEFSDSAPGVPPTAIDKLCNRFYRVDNSRSRETGGSGLGLAICKTIIEDHNGKFIVRNSSLGGLSVSIELPLTSNTQTNQ